MILRLPFLSFLISPRALIVCASLAALLTIGFLAAISLGAYPLTLSQILQAIAGQADAVQQMIVLDHRMPRTLTAIGAGAAFGLAGSLFQTMLRNPLASPDVIGFGAGASCGALLALVLTGGMVLPGALIGGLLTASVVIALAWKDGLHPYRMILVGIGVSLSLSACADVLMTRLDAIVAADMAKWLVGSLNARSWDDVHMIWAGLLALAPVVVWLQFPLGRMTLADDIATGLGLPLSRLRLMIVATAVALVALAVSVAGPLPFVAFVSGPIARRLVRGGRPALFASAGIGALVTLMADMAARSVPIVHLPAGVFTALIGAPVLMWLLLVQFRKGTL